MKDTIIEVGNACIKGITPAKIILIIIQEAIKKNINTNGEFGITKI